MGKIKWFAFGLMLILLFPIYPSLAETELGGGRISLLQGRVFLQTVDEGEWTEASLNFPIANGDRIMTEWDGKVELQFKDGTYVRVGEGSTLEIIALSLDRAKSFIHLSLAGGKIYVNRISTIRETPSLYLDLPYGILSSHIPARFRVDVVSSETKISVLQGSVEWKGEGRSIPLSQGKTLIVRSEGHTVLGGLYGRDEWDRWNEAMDNEILNRRYAQKYLPPELETWGSEIESYGRWVYVQEYRYVWVPIVSVGFVPFRHGHWVWRKGVYCWVPREPWGWVPFHYGRWIYLPHYGWVWVPPVPRVIFWHPGAVAWHIGPKHISWVPLAPGEPYYGYHYYGPNSVNLNRSNINIQRSIPINAKVRDAVVTIPRESFYKKHPVTDVEIKENPFLHPGKISGPPVEKPLPQEKPITPLRFLKEFPERPKTELKTERVPLSKEGRREIFPSETRSKGVEPQQSTPTNYPKVRERETVQPSPVPKRVQEMTPRKESVPDPIVREERSLPNRVISENRNPNFPPLKERVSLPPDYQERREQKSPVPFSGREKLRVERPYSLTENQRFNAPTPLSSKRIESTFTFPEMRR